MSVVSRRSSSKFTAADWLSEEILALAQRLCVAREERLVLGKIVRDLAETTTENRATHLKIESSDEVVFLKKAVSEPPLNKIVGTTWGFSEGVVTPLIFDEENSALYFFRHYGQELRTAENFVARARVNTSSPISPSAERIIESALPFPLNTEQKRAVCSVISRPMTVISGGPGTGKTTLLLRALLCLFTENPEIKIILAAPTGKAAGRMKDAIRAQAEQIRRAADSASAFPPSALQRAESLEVATLHRVLKVGTSALTMPDVPVLNADCVITDESSMVDQFIMHRLLAALRPSTRLVLVGDKNQLDSVGAGRVFGAICASRELADSRVELKESRRFDAGGILGRLARGVVEGDAASVAAVLDNNFLSDVREREVYRFLPGEITSDVLNAAMMDVFPEKLRSVPVDADPEEMLSLLDSARVITPLRRGKFGSDTLNAHACRLFASSGAPSSPHFHGRPVIITHNAPQERLFNGDTGIVLRDSTGAFSAYFRGDDGKIRRIPATLLPEHETAYAMSIHKAQGSEFSRLCVIFPPEGAQPDFFSRQLLYTALTRFREDGKNSRFRLLFDRLSLLNAVVRDNPMRELLFARKF